MDRCTVFHRSSEAHSLGGHGLTTGNRNPDAHRTVNRHIKLLHDYNEIRDVGQGLIGLIAEARGERVGVVQEEYGLGVKD